MKLGEVPIGEYVVIPIDALPEEIVKDLLSGGGSGGTVMGKVVALDDVHMLDGREDVLQESLKQGYKFVNLEVKGSAVTIAMHPNIQTDFYSYHEKRCFNGNDYWVEQWGDLSPDEPLWVGSIETFKEAISRAKKMSKESLAAGHFIVMDADSKEPCLLFTRDEFDRLAFRLREDRPLRPDQKQALLELTKENDG